jgi:hypothetical protein
VFYHQKLRTKAPSEHRFHAAQRALVFLFEHPPAFQRRSQRLIAAYQHALLRVQYLIEIALAENHATDQTRRQSGQQWSDDLDNFSSRLEQPRQSLTRLFTGSNSR